ncbi:hypothetical protein EG329_002448 [Mollisiaceae sp. DMI_Dod_QoI]|nr:hypothetical protein EG329_002448 [Helotiales sp. DMI_Dod_QoI]
MSSGLDQFILEGAPFMWHKQALFGWETGWDSDECLPESKSDEFEMAFPNEAKLKEAATNMAISADPYNDQAVSILDRLDAAELYHFAESFAWHQEVYIHTNGNTAINE